ncbi:MAG: tetratricopeptide repeat protein [Deltaproteobacteria bacterium]|nr:tetratricopeptide repeat protein [Deltaproteobacteria bacterium]
MPTANVERKLTAILSADVKGYSRLMGEDENADLPAERRMEFRIGINVGDVIVEGPQIYGDGVNIAARLEALAEGGGVCIAGTAYDQVENKLTLGYEYLGEQTVKNIAKPVRVYRVQGEAEATAIAQGRGERSSPVQSPALPLPDKPSIVVLPFVNMSNDPEQEYFSDGITEDITTDLSKISSLFVISRNSAFTYKGKAAKVRDISREMGVRYVMEGSVRKVGERVRISAQLIDATTDHHLWAERYDRPLTDIFAVQDEIVQQLVTTLRVEVHEAELERVRRIPTTNLSAYDALLRGEEYLHRVTIEANAQARQLFERARALDPHYGEAYAWLGWTCWVESHRSPDPQHLEQALALAQQAITLNDSLPLAHSLMSLVYGRKQQHDQAITAGERAVTLDPNNAYSAAWLAEVMNFAGKPAGAIGWAEKAMRLDPHYPYWFAVQLGFAYRMTGRYGEAIAAQKQALLRDLNSGFPYPELASNYVQQWGAQLSQDPQTLAQALVAARQATALNDSYWGSHLALGTVYLYQQQYEQALAERVRTVALNPNGAVLATLAEVLSRMGRADDALRAAEQALRLKFWVADLHLLPTAVAYALAGRYEEALAPLQQYLTRYPDILEAHLTLATVYSELGKEAEARAETAEVLRLNPHFSLEVHKQREPIKDPALLERQIVALRKAGLK